MWQRLKTHITEIFIDYEEVEKEGRVVRIKRKREEVPDPITLCRMLSWSNWLYFLVGLAAWTVDGYDFHCVSLSMSSLAKDFHVRRDEVAESITLTLLFRCVGATIFGFTGDIWGRKWSLIVNLLVIAILQVGTAYARTFHSFLAVRALFGIGMGGIWGLSAAMSLENMPVVCRGLFSGILQQGYPLGFLIGAVLNLYLVPVSRFRYIALFYIGAGVTGLVALTRLGLPESRQFLEAKKHGRSSAKYKLSAFLKEGKVALKAEWRSIVYCSILLAMFGSNAHVSMDLYPTYMQQSKGFSHAQASRATIIAMTGCILGGATVGFFSQKVGRRATIIFCCFAGACVIPLWTYPDSWGSLVAGAFMLQFVVQGAYGIIPIHLSEISPPQFRAAFPGITYQLGQMISSPVIKIVSSIAEKYKVERYGKTVPSYGITLAVGMAIGLILEAVIAALGPERRGRHFEDAAAIGDNVYEGTELTSCKHGSDLEVAPVETNKTNVSIVERPLEETI